MQAILANRIAPGLIDKYLASAGYSGQLSHETSGEDAPANLFEPVPGPYGAHGRFDEKARSGSGRCSPTGTAPRPGPWPLWGSSPWCIRSPGAWTSDAGRGTRGRRRTGGRRHHVRSVRWPSTQ